MPRAKGSAKASSSTEADGYRLRARKLRKFAQRIGDAQSERQLGAVADAWDAWADRLDQPSDIMSSAKRTVGRSRALLDRLSKKKY